MFTVGGGVGEGVAVAVALGVAVVVAVGVALTPTVADTSLEGGLCIMTVLDAVTTKKYVLPLAKFERVAVVEFPTSMTCVYVWEAVP